MKFTVAIFAAIAAVANAQSQCEAAAESIPACALGYIASAASANYGCGVVDFQCQCSNSQALQGSLAGTLAQVCTDINAVLQGVGAVCSCASSNPGMTLTATPASCEASAAAIPPCALGYLASAGKAIGGCSVQDFACQCSNSAAIQQSIAGPLASACGQSVGNVISSAGALCSCAAGAGGSSGGSGSAAGSSAAMTTGAASGGAMSGGAATAGSGSSAPKATSSAKASGGSSPGFSTFTGGAATASVGGVLAFIGGLVAML